jgi:hypothetical protein
MPGPPKKRARKEKVKALTQDAPAKRERGAHLHASDTYDPELGAKACDLIEYEGFWPEQAARSVGLNGRRTLEFWSKTHPEFHARYARARANGSHKFATKAVEILENAAASSDMPGSQVTAVRNCADGYKWYASKLNPAIYGDKLDLTATVGIVQLTDGQIDAKLDALLAMAKGLKNG